MKFMDNIANLPHRKPLLAGAVVVLGAGAGLLGLEVTNGDSLPGKSSAPATSATPESAVDTLERMLVTAQIAGIVVTKWASCPQGPGAEVLPDNMRVNAYVLGGGESSSEFPEKPLSSVDIIKVTAYRAHGGTVAWCGESLGTDKDSPIVLPPKGSIIVIPNDPACLPPEPGQALPCPGQPLVYDAQPSTTPGGSIPLHAPPQPGTIA
jgi:hypothetical protein